MIRHFIENLKDKLDVNARMMDGWTPFFYAAINGYLISVEVLYKDGHVPINDVDRFNRTVLHWVARYNNKSMVRRLLDMGLQYDALDNEGMTALDLAKQYNNYEVAQLLVQHKAQLEKNQKSTTGKKK